jgi:predicted phage-related endonuclease
MRFKKQIANEIKSNILKLNVQIPVKRAEVEKLYADKRDMVVFKVKKQEALVNEKVTMAESMKKEIENRIDQEKKKQTDGLTKKGKDALKGLFK